MAGFRAGERGFSEADLERALDPRSNVALRAKTSGPAPAETERIVRDWLERIAAGEERLEQFRNLTRRRENIMKKRTVLAQYSMVEASVLLHQITTLNG